MNSGIKIQKKISIQNIVGFSKLFLILKNER